MDGSLVPATRVFYAESPSARPIGQPVGLSILSGPLRSLRCGPAQCFCAAAEIRACCRLAALLDLPLTAAAQNVVPVAVTAAESVERLRSWAAGRCPDAESSGIYQGDVQIKPSRKLRRADPSNN